jgi:hypothetical protein
MSVQRVGCVQGWEPDLFSQNCAIRQSANVVLGACWLVIGIWFVASELFLRASSAQSFSDIDREKQAVILLRGLYAMAGMLTYGRLAYEWGEWDDSSVVTRVSFIVFNSCGAWWVILTYRALRSGISMGFTLRKDLSQLLRNLSGLKTLHVAGFVLVYTRSAWNLTYLRSDAARRELLLSFMFCGMGLFFLFHFFAAVMASRALRDLPPTNQSVAIREKLQAFKQTMVEYCIWNAFVGPIMGTLCYTLLLEYSTFVFGCGTLISLIPNSVINLAKLRHRTKKHPTKGTRKGQPHTVQIMPVASTTKPLREWESEGRQSEDPYHTNLPPDVQAFGVPGVSLALLKKLAEEHNIPADWTMTQVCAEVVKPQTHFQVKHAKVHCAYAALIGEAVDGKGRLYVGKATQFLSYAWKYSWKVVFTALELFEQHQVEAGAEPSYFFIDQFCLDQHEMSSTTHNATDEKVGIDRL